MFKLKKSLFLLLFLSSGTSAQPKLQLESFVSDYLANSSQLKSKSLERQVAELNRDAAQDPYETVFGIGPQVSRRNYEFPAGSDEITSVNLQASASRSFTSGFAVTSTWLGGESEASDGSRFKPSSKFEIGIEQDLSKNFLGRLDDSKAREAQLLLSSQEQSLNQEQLDQCTTAAALFIDTYFLQQISSLYRSNVRDAEELFQYFSDFYEKKHVKKIDFLRSKLDFLAVKSAFEEHENSFRQSLIRMETAVSKELPKNLHEPKTELLAMSLEGTKFDPKKSPLLASLKHNEQAAKEKLNVTRWESQSDWTLSMTAGRQKQEKIDYKAGVTSEDEDYVTLGLSLTLPLSSKTAKLATRQAAIDHRLAEEQINDAEQKLLESWRTTLAGAKFYRTQADIAEQKVKVSEQQQTESRRLTKALQMELTDYIRDRQSAVQQRIGLLQLQLNYMKSLLELRRLSYNSPSFCQTMRTPS
ncbi:TolC family protein [Pseudobacteriovorax antillogorgiicola]|uniref:Outer membrane protein TolC n=1 Tax=Pseudobacteriovorax antillogorgiicola TaxID=1513793 RepID=A0A1Y6CMA3_9BACT|nr:TolC family protein [Pseudobacteriovorax antillogorgiicola]TCS44792.1 outer membrane protein TolC [Pseudobacteriovorax antillogorgiicola]SMF77424.1 Outer membrane protein TolC [Pseudobacteriovorax antillogorgiicola]